jgi:protein-tyrosine-phosphatase
MVDRPFNVLFFCTDNSACDQAAAEVCSIWPGHPMTAHWGVEDPVAADGDER